MEVTKARREFEADEETDKEIKSFAQKSSVCLLSMVAPFTPERVAPGRVIYAEFRYPEEFIIEDFIGKLEDKFPSEQDRPPLYLLIHSPGGYVSSAYIIASVLREHFKRIVAFIPHVAASGATLLAISCDEIIMGNISQLSPIDPYYREDDKIMYAISIINAFRNLDEYFSTKDVAEASYPYKHFVDTLTPEIFDRAVRMVGMVERYTIELLEKAGYDESARTKIIDALLREATLHEEVIKLTDARDIGIKVKYWKEDEQYIEAWNILRTWLRKYYQQPSLVHIIKYVLPEPGKGK